MKKIFVLAFAMSYIFGNIIFAEEIKKDCGEELEICFAKCTESNVQSCEELCYEKQDLCIENENTEKPEE